MWPQVPALPSLFLVFCPSLRFCQLLKVLLCLLQTKLGFVNPCFKLQGLSICFPSLSSLIPYSNCGMILFLPLPPPLRPFVILGIEAIIQDRFHFILVQIFTRFTTLVVTDICLSRHGITILLWPSTNVLVYETENLPPLCHVRLLVKSCVLVLRLCLHLLLRWNPCMLPGTDCPISTGPVLEYVDEEILRPLRMPSTQVQTALHVVFAECLEQLEKNPPW
mmetsp:Transcript_39642/g.91503  ORF Transcript_39642/g.91503 Transcript_39642/m.91503 type:complete len:221 (-) Transcript_39642:892-1554(-)